MLQASSITVPARAGMSDSLHAASVRPEWIAVATFIVLFVTMLTQVLSRTGGFLVYSLDDPYIHIAMAERLLSGHYGINAGEVTSPSSSVIWPFLLLPTAGTPLRLYMPMALNVVFASTTAYVLGRFAAQIDLPAGWRYARAARLMIAALLVFSTNLVGLAFTGLEHNLQVLIAVVVAWSLLLHTRGGDLSRWVLALAALGPAVRYELFAITAAVCLVLAMDRRWREMLAVGAGSLVLPVALATFLVANGNFPLPNSVMAKLGSGSAVGSGGIIQALLGGSGALAAYFQNSFGAKVAMIACIAIAGWGVSRSTGRDRAVFAAGVLVGVLHMTAGQFGWFFRYELYALAFCGMIAIRAISVRAPSVPVLGLMATAWCYLPALVMTPGGAANIYEQQYQMHRFVSEHYPKPFAVLDIGWVSVGRKHDGYVVDLLGLASNEAVRQRDKSAEWLDDVTRRHDAGLAMIYVEAFKRVPQSWTKVGRLELSSQRMTASYSAVNIYATGVGDKADIMSRLSAFKPKLPAGVKLEIH